MLIIIFAVSDRFKMLDWRMYRIVWCIQIFFSSINTKISYYTLFRRNKEKKLLLPSNQFVIKYNFNVKFKSTKTETKYSNTPFHHSFKNLIFLDKDRLLTSIHSNFLFFPFDYSCRMISRIFKSRLLETRFQGGLFKAALKEHKKKIGWNVKEERRIRS